MSSSATERIFVAGARACAIFVVAIAPLVITMLVIETIAAFIRGIIAIEWTQFVELTVTTLGLGAVGATLGTIIGVGAALYTVEIASTSVRQAAKAVIGALHAVPAVGIGIAAGGVLLFATWAPSTAFALTVGAVALTIMIASVVFVQMRREIAQLPPEVRQAAAAVGADRVQVAARAVMPALRRQIAGIWWSAFALALGEATALQIVVTAVNARFAVTPENEAPLQGTLATALLQGGAAVHGPAVIGFAPAALVLLLLVLAAVMLGRRASGYVQWP